MLHILFDCPNVQNFREELKSCFSPSDTVAVVAFSFYDDYVFDEKSWDRVYGAPDGKDYLETVQSFSAFGIPKESITFINYFKDTKDSAAEKIRRASVVYFTGGLPDRMMDRIREFALEDVLLSHRGTVIGYSAGAVIQLAEYHLSPDADYPAFGYYRGLPYLEGFALEVHYEGKACQKDSIRRVLAEKHLPVYVLHTACGGLIAKDGQIRRVGHVDLLTPDMTPAQIDHFFEKECNPT
ncbi:MAG: Type 1 glutamine amidotransferase-like domain-containing protein [Clostridia bacterium]|nr:Type 1 glutamine amidotransferase-like domain-containing protein [Clostridia bacterium]